MKDAYRYYVLVSVRAMVGVAGLATVAAFLLVRRLVRAG